MTAGTQAATLYYEVILEVEDVNGTVKDQRSQIPVIVEDRSLHGLSVSVFYLGKE